MRTPGLYKRVLASGQLSITKGLSCVTFLYISAKRKSDTKNRHSIGIMETLAKIRKSEFASPVEPPASIDISLRRGDSYESDERSSSSPDELAREEDELTVGLLYETRFDPREYFDQYCKSEDDPELEFWFQNLHQVFATGNDCVF